MSPITDPSTNNPSACSVQQKGSSLHFVPDRGISKHYKSGRFEINQCDFDWQVSITMDQHLLAIIIMDILKILFKAQNDGLPELLSNNIYKERRNGYSLRGGECLSVPRFETRFMKDSLVYRGTVLWNTICLNENGIAHLSKKDRNLIRTKDYFKI